MSELTFTKSQNKSHTHVFIGLHKTSKHVLWCLSQRPSCSEVAPQWIEFVGPAHHIDWHSDWEMENLQAKGMPLTLCHAPQTIPEQFCSGMQCGRMDYPVERGHCHQGTSLPWKVYVLFKLLGRWYCQNYIHMNARTQGFQAEHCPEHSTASTDLPTVYPAPIFP